jgi:hypothetical protein
MGMGGTDRGKNGRHCLVYNIHISRVIGMLALTLL